MNVTDDSVKEDKPFGVGKFTGSSASFYSSKPLARTLIDYVDPKKLKAEPRDFYISTTDYFAKENITRECKSFGDNDDLLRFILASASPPTFFSPVIFEGKTLVDGGLTSNYNVAEAIKLEDVTTVILMVPSPKETRKYVSSMVDMIEDSISIGMQNQLKEEIGSVNRINKIISKASGDITGYKNINLITIIPTLPINFGFLDFKYKGYDRKELIQYGYDLAKPLLERYILST